MEQERHAACVRSWLIENMRHAALIQDSLRRCNLRGNSKHLVFLAAPQGCIDVSVHEKEPCTGGRRCIGACMAT